MADIRYAIVEPLATGVSAAMRMAVLTPVLGVGADKDLQQAFDRLRHRWHDCLVGVRKAGWAPARRLRDFQYMRNCPPFGVRTDVSNMHTCKRATVCPFCWARRVVAPLYAKLRSWLTTVGRNWSPPYGTQLVEYKTTATVWGDVGAGRGSAARLGRAALAARAVLRNTRNDEFKAYRAVAGLSVSRFVVKPERLVLIRAGFLLVPSGLTHKAEFLARKHRLRAYRRTTRKVLLPAIARVCAYPAAMLRASGPELRAFLDLLKGEHVFSSRGRPVGTDVLAAEEAARA